MVIPIEQRFLPGAGTGPGRAGEAFRAADWSSSPLGSVASWPPHLRFAVELTFAIEQPVFACWGERHLLLHNDGCLVFGGGRVMLGRPLAEAWPEVAALLVPASERLRATGCGELLEDRRLLLARRLPREEIFLTFSCSSLRNESGVIGGMLVICTETTAAVLDRRRIRAEQELAGRLRQATSPVAVCRRAGEILAATDAFPFALIYLRPNGSGRLLLAAAAGQTGVGGVPRLIEGGRHPLLSVLARGSPELLESKAVGIAGGEVPAAFALPLLAPGGGCLGVLALGLDPCRPFDESSCDFCGLLAAQVAASLDNARCAQERQQARPTPRPGEGVEDEGRLLAESESRLRAIIDFAPAAIFVKDLCFNYVTVNQHFLKIVGHDRGQVKGRDDNTLFPKEVADRFRATDKEVLTSGTPVELEEEFQQEDGLHTYLTVKFPLVDDLGHLYGLAGISTDMTDRKRSEEELRQIADELARSNRELEQFASIVSHDLREPLRTIGGFLNLMQRRYADHMDRHAQELIHFAMDGAERLDRMITDLLEYSRVQRQEPVLGPVDLFDVWLVVIDSLHALIEETGAHIVHDPLPVVIGDAAQLTRLLQNLVGNAIKFRGGRRPEIHIGISRRDNEWLIAVRDNGIGIPPQFAERIFQVFQRLHTQKEYPGTGIGLAICKKIVERHGGRIWVKSQPGQGSTFSFTLADRPASLIMSPAPHRNEHGEKEGQREETGGETTGKEESLP